MNKGIRVWDPLVRIFHWSLVLAFTVAFLTGDEENITHIVAGYVVLGLISFRLVWGVIGTRHARFSDFVYSPATVIRYLKGLFSYKPEHYRGHNPAGGWMVILMLITLIIVSWTGLKVYAEEEGKGPLASNYPEFSMISIAHADDDERDDDRYEYQRSRGEHVEYDDDEDEKHEEDDEDGEEEHGENDNGGEEDEFWEELHEGASNFMLLLVVLHIMGVIIAGNIHGENLVKAMITGYKKE